MGILQGEPNMKVATIIRTIEEVYQGYKISYGKTWRAKQLEHDIWGLGGWV
jgi:alanine racemase